MNDLLKVLDMSEEEQWVWLEKKYGAGAFHSFPTLAFMLRDEILKKEKFWYGNLHIVYSHIKRRRVDYDIAPGVLSQYFLFEAKPIHWIIAALIAKEKEENER